MHAVGWDQPIVDQRRAVRAWTAALVLLCVATLWLQFRHIESTLPYPRHVDEAFISGPAHRTVVTGTLHPYTFNYPSLPKYLTAAGMALGFVRGAAELETSDVQRIGNVGYPYYETRRAMQTARQLFVVLSVIALAATGASAWLAFRQPVTILLAPLILVASPLFFFHSWTYLNVDIVGACFVMLTIAFCLLGTRGPSLHQSAVIPGIFAGLSAGSKYTMAVVGLPVLVAIGLQFRGVRRIGAWTLALAAMATAFLAAVPYSLIDIPGFLNGVASEAYHYASGHRGFMSDPGLPQLQYYARHFASEFALGAVVAVAGLWLYAVADWRRAVVLTIFPAALLWLLASQRVHFPRNVLSVQPLIAMFAAFGAVSLHRWVVAWASRRGWSAPNTRRLRVLAAVVLAIAAIPPWHVAEHFRDRTDSRNLARAWIEERVPPEWTIVVPTELGFDARQLEAAGRRVVAIDLRSARDAGALQSIVSGVPSPAIIMAPRWGADVRYPGEDVAKVLNDVARGWRAMRTFGTNDVLVNYSYPNPWGDPAFAVAVLK
ncbi:MAG: hypothetical protein GEU82_05475 [Luteitalea sp.]|nr:hypothetical protein [Luteitalea sp.]